MEILGNIIGSVIQEVAGPCCTCVCSNTITTVFLKSNLKNLEKNMKNLKDLGLNVQHQLESEEKEEKPASTKAEEWLKEVEELEKRVNSFLGSHLVANNKETSGCFSGCKERCKLGREVAELLEEVERLKESGRSKKLFKKAEVKKK